MGRFAAGRKHSLGRPHLWFDALLPDHALSTTHEKVHLTSAHIATSTLEIDPGARFAGIVVVSSRLAAGRRRSMPSVLRGDLSTLEMR